MRVLSYLCRPFVSKNENGLPDGSKAFGIPGMIVREAATRRAVPLKRIYAAGRRWEQRSLVAVDGFALVVEVLRAITFSKVNGGQRVVSWLNWMAQIIAS